MSDGDAAQNNRAAFGFGAKIARGGGLFRLAREKGGKWKTL